MFARAEEIFRIGQVLPADVKAAAGGRAVRLAVGLSDGLSRLDTQRAALVDAGPGAVDVVELQVDLADVQTQPAQHVVQPAHGVGAPPGTLGIDRAKADLHRGGSS